MGNDQTSLHAAAGLECALAVFQDRKAVMAWLHRPNLTLANRRPVDVLATAQGCWEVQRVLNAIATGGVA
jgi:uncharacterized protein (DUF2384 family)